MRQSIFLPRLVLIAVCFLLTGISHAAEVDSFTDRRELADSRIVLNRVVNLWLEEAVTVANKKTIFQGGDEQGVDYCNRTRLFEALKGKFTGFVVGKLESLVTEDVSLDGIRVEFENSIYRDFEFTESPTMSLTGRLAVLLRIGDVYLGADKFGHFFTEGLSYYEMYAALDKYSALQFGDLSESLFYGELTTGVFSYADLAANLNGLRFWNSIFALKPDPISSTPEKHPYVRCIDKKWQLTRQFDWRDYVDQTWDEAINCSALRNDVLLAKMQKRIAETTDGGSCPLIEADRRILEKKYDGLLKYIYNPDGNKVLREPLQPKFELYWSTILGRLKISRFFIVKPDEKTI
jgi:hypothetical protein